MREIIEAFGRYFERFVRWVYPGMLFLLLLHLGRPDLLRQFRIGGKGIWGIIILIVVFSFIIYSLHRYVLHEIYLLFAYLIGYSAPGRIARKRKNLPECRKFQIFEDQKSFLIKRFCENQEKRETSGKQTIDGFSDYLFNRWAVTHAMGLTGWVLIAMYRIASENSCLGGFRLGILIIGILFFLGYGYQTLLLTEVETKFIENEIVNTENQ